MKRRQVLQLAGAALACPAAAVRVAAASPAVGAALFDSRYPQSVAAVTAAGGGAADAWVDLHGADPVRLWRERLLPMMRAGATVRGCSTYAAWCVLRYSALEARQRPQLLRAGAVSGTAAALVTWRLSPTQRPG